MHIKENSFRNPLGRALGRGSAHDGTHHWWLMKITSLALIPLTLWFVWSVLGLVGADQVAVAAWLKQPLHAVMMLLFLGFTLHHSANGIQVVLEDYMRGNGLKVACILANKLFHMALAGFGLFAVILVALKG